MKESNTHTHSHTVLHHCNADNATHVLPSVSIQLSVYQLFPGFKRGAKEKSEEKRDCMRGKRDNQNTVALDDVKNEYTYNERDMAVV